LNAFHKVYNKIEKLGDVDCHFEVHSTEAILKISLQGTCGIGSQGGHYGQYIYQSIGLALLTHQPIGVIVDLRNLNYEYGDRILNLFQVFSDVKPMGHDLILAYVISNNNKYGLSSLLQLNLKALHSPFFDDYHKALNYVFKAYDAI
jgi:hypothetical protein